MNNSGFLHYLTPWEASPTLVVIFVLSGLLFFLGSRKMRLTWGRIALFWTGWIILYLSLHTQADYYAERVFFAHRIQHVILHHLGPLLVMLAYPGQVMLRGLPFACRYQWRRLGRTVFGRFILALITNKVLIPILFVMMVLFWLIPIVQFYAMLDWRLYRFMNWSVVITGFMYWNLILDRRPCVPHPITAKTWLGKLWQRFVLPGKPAVMTVRERIVSPILTMIPQMAVGIWMVFTPINLYPLFELCGRAVSISSLADQSLGAFIMWVPAALVETFGFVIALYHGMQLSARGRLIRAQRAQEVTTQPYKH